VWLEGEGGAALKKLEVDATLKSNFCQCVIVEFPTLLVGVKGQCEVALAAPACDEKARHGDKGGEEGEGGVVGVAEELKERVSSRDECMEVEVEGDNVSVEVEEGELEEGEWESGGEEGMEGEEDKESMAEGVEGRAWEEPETIKEEACSSLSLIANAYGQSDDGSDQEEAWHN